MGFSETLSKWIAAIARYISEIIIDWVSRAWHPNPSGPPPDIEKAGEDTFARTMADIGESGVVGREIVEELKEIAKLPAILRYPIWGWYWMTILGTRIAGWVSAVSNLQAQRLNTDLRPNMISADTVIRWMLQNPDNAATVAGLLDKMGLPNEQQVLMLQALRQYPALGELLILVNRKEITLTEAIETLRAQGVNYDDATNMLKLRFWHPSPSDLVMLAGREAFEEEAIDRFNLDADLEQIDPEPFEKAGMTKEQMRWYWVAHWMNPSIQQVFEMIHRGALKPDGKPFTLDDLDIFYRVADINPFFGDLLRQIAFRPLPRVDIRRMYAMGVLDREAVKTAYSALGYNPEHAEMMTEFTVRLAKGATKNLTRAQLGKAYKLGLTEPEMYLTQLQESGYDEGEAESIKAITDAEVQEKRDTDNIRAIAIQYKRRRVDTATTIADLSRLGISTARVTEYLDDWAAEKIVQRRLPTKEDVLKWRGSDQIDALEFRRMMRDLKFDEDTIDLYEGS